MLKSEIIIDEAEQEVFFFGIGTTSVCGRGTLIVINHVNIKSVMNINKITP